MKVIDVRNVNEALPRGVALLRDSGVPRLSRNGPVIVSPEPVTTVYRYPWERVLFSPARDANPFFHLFEGAWMLAGRYDVASVARYAKQLAAYSDDGTTLHGAYGRRWRKWFVLTGGHGLAEYRDQVKWAITRLRKDPLDRRVVISMWDANVDPAVADAGGKDVPCNTQLYVWCNDKFELCLTITCRSNDILWGAYGANAVHFSMLQEHIAQSLGLPIGPMWQLSNNFHAYAEVLEKYEQRLGGAAEASTTAYTQDVTLTDVTGIGEEGMEDRFYSDLGMMFDHETPVLGMQTGWIRKVLHPVMASHALYRDKTDKQRFTKALDMIKRCGAPDWRRGCEEWLLRRQAAALRAADDGVSHE